MFWTRGARHALEVLVSTASLVGCGLLGAGQEERPPPTTVAAKVELGSTDQAAATSSSSRKAADGATAPITSSTSPEAAAPETDLPAINRNPVPSTTITQSKGFEDAGERSYKAQDVAGSLPYFMKAIHADPGNLHARYELARSLVNLGRIDGALAILTSLRDFGCALCLERVLAAESDPAFAALHQDPRYLELTKGGAAGLPTLETAGKRIVNWFMFTEQKVWPREDLMDPRALIVIDDRSGDGPQRYQQVFGDQELRAFIKEHFTLGVYPGSLGRCSKGCCTVTNNEILGVHLNRFCFKMHETGAVHLYKLEVDGDPGASFPG